MPERRSRWMNPGDDAILEAISEGGTERLAFVASGRGLHLEYVEDRCRDLETHGMVERIDSGVYRLTERGERYLDGEAPRPATERPPTERVSGD